MVAVTEHRAVPSAVFSTARRKPKPRTEVENPHRRSGEEMRLLQHLLPGETLSPSNGDKPQRQGQP